MRNCNSGRECGVHVRMRLAARVPKQAARRWLGQSGMQTTTALALICLGNRPRWGPCAARSPHRERARPAVPNGNALMMRMRPFWVNGDPCLVKMLW